jgi:hypothetical protein
MINVTYINNLLLSGLINQNIPSDYYNLHKTLIYYLDEFVRTGLDNNFYNFEKIISQNKFNKPYFKSKLTNPISKIKFDLNKKDPAVIEVIKSWTDINLSNFDKIVDDINALIIGRKSINGSIKNLSNLKKSSNFNDQLLKLNNLVQIFEERYKPNRLYKYTNTIRPNLNLTDQSTTINGSAIKEVNRFYVLLISMGIIATKNIFRVYYLNILLKLLYTSNIFNFAVNTKNSTLVKQLKEIINNFIDNNIFDFVRRYYFIKLDQYDKLNTNVSIIDEYMTKLVELLIQNGLVVPDSDIEKNIKQYINPHVGELLGRTLQYSQVLIDILHRYIINLYYSMKTFDVLSS